MKVHWLGYTVFLALIGSAGCSPAKKDDADLVYSSHGIHNGEVVKPRAIAIDSHDNIYIVDFTARIQVFDRAGKYSGIGWTTPDSSNGRPSGISITPDGNVLLSDSHYHCLRIYSPDGHELRMIAPVNDDGTPFFHYIGDAVQDEDGYFYVAESLKRERLVKLDRDGKVVAIWGSEGREPGQFQRIRALVLGPDGLIYLADACNHRIQVFTRNGELVRVWGKMGRAEGELSYPYDLAFGPKGELYVAEFGNHRVQKFTPEGEFLGSWGGPGSDPGQLRSPWGLAVDSKGAVHVLDSENHRIQRI
jgi:DNA-binding beta-propeller fold protein YncE